MGGMDVDTATDLTDALVEIARLKEFTEMYRGALWNLAEENRQLQDELDEAEARIDALKGELVRG